MLHVTFVLVRDNYASTSLAPLEVFHSAGYLWPALRGEKADPEFSVTLASVDGKSVTSHQGVCITPQCAIREIEQTDLIMLPASGLDLETQLPRHEALYPWLRHWHGNGAYVASVCTGAAFLAHAGLLDGRRATTHWAVMERYAALFPAVNWQGREMIVEDSRVLSAGGVHAGVDMSLYLVERFCGRDVAIQCARALVLDMPRTHQSGYAVLPLSRPHDDHRIREVEDHISEHYSENLSIEVLARRACMSPRTFIRRFKGATGYLPGHYLQSQRIAVAQSLLESSLWSVQAICHEVGYEDVAFFRKVFRRETGMTPGEYRTKFGHPVPVCPGATGQQSLH